MIEFPRKDLEITACVADPSKRSSTRLFISQQMTIIDCVS